MKNQYNALRYRKLKGSHIVHSDSTLPSIQSLVGELKRFVLLLKAPCGLGKTLRIIEFLNYLISLAKQEGISFLCVCSRIVLSKKQLEDLKELGVEHYQNFTGLIKNVNKLIVTIDSLHRVRGRYDIIIFDEFSYTMSQLVNFSKNKEKNIDALIERITHTDKIIVADAYLMDPSIRIFEELRPKEEIIFYENNYPVHQNKTVHVYDSSNIWYDEIFRDISEGKKLVICCGSKENIALTLEKILSPLCTLACYTSDDAIENDPTTEWDQYQVVIYTSVLEAGNSFTKLHFDKVYGNFTTWSFGPESAAQMVYRARQTTTGEIHLFVDQTGWNDKIPDHIKTYNEINRYIIEDSNDMREELFGSIRMSYLVATIDVNHPYTYIYTDVRYRENIGKRRYLRNLLALLKSSGVKWGSFIDKSAYMRKYDMNKALYKAHMEQVYETLKTERFTIKYEKYVKICRSRDSDYVEASRIRNSPFMTEEDKYILWKHDLKDHFRMPIRDVDPVTEGINVVDEPAITPENISKVINNLKIHTNITLCKDLSCDDGNLTLKMKKVLRQFQADENYEVSDQDEYTKARESYSLPDTLTDLDLYNIKTSTQSTPDHKVLPFKNLLLSEIINRAERKNPSTCTRLHLTKKMRRYRQCMHAVKLLRMLGCNQWLETYVKYDKLLLETRSSKTPISKKVTSSRF